MIPDRGMAVSFHVKQPWGRQVIARSEAAIKPTTPRSTGGRWASAEASQRATRSIQLIRRFRSASTDGCWSPGTYGPFISGNWLPVRVPGDPAKAHALAP